MNDRPARERLLRLRRRVDMLEEVVVSRSRELVVANRRLRETIDCLGGLYRLMPGMVLVVDRRGAIRSISESGAWLLEYSVPELIGTPATLIFESLDVPAVFSALERLPARDAIIRTEALCTSRNGLKAPTEFAATIALRTQQILAHESGVTNTVDPLGGSYFVETLTNEVERGAWDYIHKIDALGGMVAAIEQSYPQREIADASYRYQMAVDHKEKIIVGVNEYIGEEKPIDVLQIGESVRASQAERLRNLRAARSGDEVIRRLAALRKAAQGTENLMPHIYDAVKAYATLGEICAALRDVFGTYEEVVVT